MVSADQATNRRLGEHGRTQPHAARLGAQTPEQITRLARFAGTHCGNDAEPGVVGLPCHMGKKAQGWPVGPLGVINDDGERLKCYDAAVAAKDYPAQVLMQWFINEQVEEEAWCMEMVERVQAATCAGGTSDLDRHIERYLEDGKGQES